MLNSRLPFLLALVFSGLLGGCGTPEIASGINDPYEEVNRRNHEKIVNGDRSFLRPAAYGYAGAVPKPVRTGISNFAANLGLPSDVLNNLLQLRLPDAMHNSVRFLVNSTVGLGGVLDPGSRIGLTARDTDFGETLHVWGAGEGVYVVFPGVGPSTTRDVVGKGVDLLINPVWYLVGLPEVLAYPVVVGLAALDTRYSFGETVDSLLYDSADSYAQTRLLYLENRRFQLSGGVQEENGDLYDLYDESFE